MPVDILVSLKAGDVKQFGQVSGAEFAKQQDLWGRLFGYDGAIKGLEDQYTDLMYVKKKPDEAVSLVYEYVNKKLNGDLH